MDLKTTIYKTLIGENVDLSEATAEHILKEGDMTHIELKPSKKKVDKKGGDIAHHDVHYRGKKIGTITNYTHHSGTHTRWGYEHIASGEVGAGSRSKEDAISDLRYAHAQHLKDNK